MRIRITSHIAGPGVDWPVGTELDDLPDAQALDLVNRGRAEVVTQQIETTSLRPAETAVRRTRKPRAGT